MSISRRNALATGAAAIVTGATVAPAGVKAAGAETALAGDLPEDLSGGYAASIYRDLERLAGEAPS